MASPRPALGALHQDAFYEVRLRFRVGSPIAPEAPCGLPLEGGVSYRHLRVDTKVVTEGEVAAQFLTVGGQDIKVVPRRVRWRLEGFATLDPEVALVPVAGPLQTPDRERNVLDATANSPRVSSTRPRNTPKRPGQAGSYSVTTMLGLPTLAPLLLSSDLSWRSILLVGLHNTACVSMLTMRSSSDHPYFPYRSRPRSTHGYICRPFSFPSG